MAKGIGYFFPTLYRYRTSMMTAFLRNDGSETLAIREWTSSIVIGAYDLESAEDAITMICRDRPWLKIESGMPRRIVKIKPGEKVVFALPDFDTIEAR